MFVGLADQDENKRGFDSKYENMDKRGDGIFNIASSIEDVQEKNISEELSKNRDELFKELDYARKLKRGKTKAIDYSKSLFENLTIPKEIFQVGEDMNADVNQLDLYVSKLSSQQVNEQYLGLVAIRKLLSYDKSAPVQDIIDRGVVFYLINFLNQQHPEFVYEATTCLTSICSGTHEQANTVVMKGGANRFIQLCDAEFYEIQIQALMGIGNLASEGVQQRDKLIELGALDKILKLVKTSGLKEIIKNCLFCLTSISKGVPAPVCEGMEPFVDYLMSFMLEKYNDDVDIVTDCIWILGYLAEHHKKILKKISMFNKLNLIVKLLDQDNAQMIIPTLRLLGAFVSGNAKLTQQVVDSGALDSLPRLLGHPSKRIRKEICWMISNIAAGTLIQVEALVAKGYLPILTRILKDEDDEIKKEAVWAICNFTLVERRDLIKSNFDNGLLETVCSILKFKEPKYIAVAMESLGNLLNCGKLYPNQDGSNPIAHKVEELGMFDLLEELQYHPVQIVYEKTLTVLEKYFELE